MSIINMNKNKYWYKLDTPFLEKMLENAIILTSFLEQPHTLKKDFIENYPELEKQYKNMRDIFTFYFATFPITSGFVKTYSEDHDDSFKWTPNQDVVRKKICSYYMTIRKILRTRYIHEENKEIMYLSRALTYPISLNTIGYFLDHCKPFLAYSGGGSMPIFERKKLFDDFFLVFEEVLAAFIYQLNDSETFNQQKEMQELDFT